jgi:hypothetical protein
MGMPNYYQDLQAGLNTRAAPNLLDLQAVYCRDCNNVQGNVTGAISKRGGLVTFATPAAALNSLYPLEATTVPYLVGTTGTSIYSINTSGTITAIKTGLATGGTRWEFMQGPSISGQGPLYGIDGTNTPQQWTGTGTMSNWTATDAGGSVPNGKYVVYSQNQAYIAGVASNPSRVYVSALNDPTGWNPANNLGATFLDFDPNDGQQITALGTVGPYVLVAKARKIWVIVQPGNASVPAVTRRLSPTIGIIAHRSIASDASGTYFLAEDRGVYVTNGSKLTPISDVIQPTIDGITGSRSLAAGVCFGNHYYLSVPANSTTNDTTLDWDTTTNSWWKHTFGSNQFAVWHPAGTAQLYSAKATGAFVDQAFVPGVYQDNGQNFTWNWYGPWQSPTFFRRRRFPTPFYTKNLRQVRVEGIGQVDVYYAQNFQTGPGTLRKQNIFSYTAGADQFGGSGNYGANDGSIFGGAPGFNIARLFSFGVARAHSLIYSGTNASPATVSSYLLLLTDRKDLVT